MRNRGYSLIEIMMVVGLIAVGSNVAVVQMKASLTVVDADVASSAVVSQLRLAREIAVNQRRNVIVQFTDPATIDVTRIESDASTTLVSSKTLPSGYTFGLPSGLGDTPDAFGNTDPVYFNASTSATFLSDGTLVTDAGLIVSGSVFTIGSGNGTSRAVTVAGANGRVKQYYIKTNAWVQR